MELIKISDIFDITYPKTLIFSECKAKKGGTPFVSSKGSNNGISGFVEELDGVKKYSAGSITVALKGTVLASFLQPEDFYCAHQIAVLVPKIKLSDQSKLFYCQAIELNKQRFNYGRQADRTFKSLLIPSANSIPTWTKDFNINIYNDAHEPKSTGWQPFINTSSWASFRYDELFDIRKGKRLTKANMTPGQTPYIGSSDSNNGLTSTIGQKAIHQGNVISLSYNGSVGEAFYQPVPFWATDDVNVLYPIGFKLNPAIALFLCAIIRKEKYRFNYGRKWHTDRMNESIMRLPIDGSGNPDWQLMELYINSLPFSSQI